MGADWPICYRDLEPYYQQAETILGVAGEPGNPYKTKRGQFPTPSHALSLKSQIIEKASDKLGWSLLPNTLALPSKSLDGRTPCQHTGGYASGCIFGAKSSVDQTAIARAQRSGRLTLLTDAQCTQVVTNQGGEVTALNYQQNKIMQRVTARAYILAGGAIETPRLMLASKSNYWSHGVGNHHGLVGAHLMETIFAQHTLQLPGPLHSYRGPPLDNRIWDFNRPVKNKRLGFVLGVSGTTSQFIGPVSYATDTPGIVLRHKQLMRERSGNYVSIFGIAEQQPRTTNRLQLATITDRAGVAMVDVHNEYSELDKQTLRDMIKLITELSAASKPINTVRRFNSYMIPSATHLGGTCLMGTNSYQSVTNHYGQIHDVNNLFITDASVLVSQGSGDSPSLTIQTLALRTAEHIAGKLNGQGNSDSFSHCEGTQ